MYVSRCFVFCIQIMKDKIHFYLYLKNADGIIQIMVHIVRFLESENI